MTGILPNVGLGCVFGAALSILLCTEVHALLDGHNIDTGFYSERVQGLVAKMSVAEKSRQLDIFRTADMLTNGHVNKSKAEATIGNLSLGVGVLHDFYPYPEIANEVMEMLIQESKSKVPPLVGAEATHGLQMDGHTIFPSPVSLSATFDKELMTAYGRVVASEARSSGVHVTWAPVMGLCRDPRWGRCEEMMGEDAYLAAALGSAAVRGFTNDGVLNSSTATAPLLKHYVAYSIPEGGHNTAPAHLGKRELLSTFVPPFAAAIDAGAQAVMVSYNVIDGEANAGSRYLLTDILRNRIGGNGPRHPFGGFVSADFGAISNLNGVHRVVATQAEAIAKFISAGGTLSGFDFDHKTWTNSIVDCVANGTLAEADLDLSVMRILAVKERLGLLNQPYVQNTSAYHDFITSSAHAHVALTAARKSMVLLQNKADIATGSTSPVLPFDADKVRSVAVVGPNGDQPQCGDYAAGGSWGGDRCGGGPINNGHTSSVVGGIKTLFPSVSVEYAPGISIDDYNVSAPYFTTIQKHSFSTPGGEPGIIGTYYKSTDFTGPVALQRNDHLISFHFLNYGPDASKLNQSAFSAVWNGHVTFDSNVTGGALFDVVTNGGKALISADLWCAGEHVLSWTGDKGRLFYRPVAVTKGQTLPIVFKYAQNDATGDHPAIALQWNLQGTDALASARAAIRNADVTVVVVGGGTSVTSGEGVDRASLGLPGAQLEFVQRVRETAVAARKPMALVVVQGKPFGEPWVAQFMPAILEAWQGGQAQGVAIAETLFGINNPAGRSAMTFPTGADVLPVYYSHLPSASRGGYNNPPLIPGGLYPPASNSDASVLWAFGHGLSYGAAFNYSHLKVSPEAPVPTNGKISITVTVTNTGDVGAEEVAQLYVRDDIASVATPVMRLCGFERTFIAAKEHVDVEFTIDVQEHLALVNVKLERTVEPGTFTFMVGGSSDKIQATASVTVVAP
eukprot:m.1523208 g.1523208  ORF g.1523208 m.1523208 type:complete len:962 (+) comp25232_c0_seq4:137-3022(+)